MIPPPRWTAEDFERDRNQAIAEFRPAEPADDEQRIAKASNPDFMIVCKYIIK
jgi:hypothetical protein